MLKVLRDFLLLWWMLPLSWNSKVLQKLKAYLLGLEGFNGLKSLVVFYKRVLNQIILNQLMQISFFTNQLVKFSWLRLLDEVFVLTIYFQ
jgi:hypothetical protein